MRLTTIIRVSKDGVMGESCINGEVSEGYSEEQIAKRSIKQLRTAKAELIVALTAKRAMEQLQTEMFVL